MPQNTVNKELVDQFVLHQVRTVRLANAIARQYREALRAADTTLMRAIKRRIRWIAARGGEQGSDFTLKRLRANLVAVRKAHVVAYRKASREMRAAVERAAKVEGQLLPQLVSGAFEVVVGESFLLPPVAASIAQQVVTRQAFEGGVLQTWIDDLAKSQAKRVERELRKGLAAGESWEELATRLNGKPVRRKGKIVRKVVDGRSRILYRGGALRIGRRHAETIARTAVNATMNGVRAAWMQESGSVLRGVTWLATLDARTTPLCISRDKHVYSIPDHQPLDGGPPWGAGPGRLHFQCRSTQAPALKSLAELEAATGKKLNLPDAKRRAVDGLYPGGTTYRDWLLRQNAKVQKEVLGVRRYRLLRDGKVKLPELFTDNGELFTLDRFAGLLRGAA